MGGEGGHDRQNYGRKFQETCMGPASLKRQTSSTKMTALVHCRVISRSLGQRTYAPAQGKGCNHHNRTDWLEMRGLLRKEKVYEQLNLFTDYNRLAEKKKGRRNCMNT